MHDEFSLDENQKRAATAPNGPIVVVAGAGTGKTRTLVGRIKHLVSSGVPPEAITVVTFTNKAAKEILGRVSRFIEGERRPVVATFHSLANRILRAHCDHVGLSRRFAIADDDDREVIVREVLKTFDPDRDVADFMRKIDGWKASGLTVSHVLDEERERRSAVDERDARIFLSIESETRRRDMIDFAGLINECNVLMASDPRIGDEISSGILHLLIDEGQDANPAQVRFARNLSRVHRNVFVVGDEDQSIYSFQGGRPSSLTKLAGDDASVFRLEENRRSTDEILRPAVRLVSQNRGRSGKVLKSGRVGVPPLVRDFSNEKEEASFLATEIRSLLKSGVSPNSIAVLVRSAFVAHPMEEALVRLDVPYEVFGGLNLSKREEVKDICAFLRLAIRPDDDLAFRRIAAKPRKGIGPAVEDAVVNHAYRYQMSISDALQRIPTIEGADVPVTLREAMQKFADQLSWLSVGFSRQDWSAIELVNYVLSDDGIGYQAFATKGGDKKSRKKQEIIDTIRGLALACVEPLELLDRITFSEEDAVPVSTSLVRIATMHSSKGLEWDHVFVPSFENGVIPSNRALTSIDLGDPGDVWAGVPAGGVEEERRLGHVAFTRAKQSLTVTYATSRKGRRSTESSFVHEAGLKVREADIYGFDEFDPFEGGKKDLGFASKASPKKAKSLPSSTELPIRRKR